MKMSMLEMYSFVLDLCPWLGGDQKSEKESKLISDYAHQQADQFSPDDLIIWSSIDRFPSAHLLHKISFVIWMTSQLRRQTEPIWNKVQNRPRSISINKQITLSLSAYQKQQKRLSCRARVGFFFNTNLYPAPPISISKPIPIGKLITPLSYEV